MKNIHILPTDKPSRLVKGETTGRLLLHNIYGTSTDRNETQNIYITFDVANINENDYIITKDGRLVQVSYLLSKDLQGASKVILTTDQELIKDGVQAIDDEFLEWFVKNPSCEEVETFKVWWSDDSYSYEIVIPKEEPKQETLDDISIKYHQIAYGNLIKELTKQETLEEEQTDILEVGQILVNEETLEYGLLQYIKICLECNNESQAIRLIEKYGFEKQEERYSKEDMEEMYSYGYNNFLPLEEAFKQFKKK